MKQNIINFKKCRINLKKIAVTVVSLCLLLSLAACSSSVPQSSSSTEPSAASLQSFTVTDQAGEKVVIKGKVSKIADSWRAHNEVDILLGAGEGIVATVLKKSVAPWMYKVNPNMSSATSTFGTDFNTEDLVEKSPDVIFMTAGDPSVAKVKSLGIPVVQLNFTNFDQMKSSISLTAQVLGGDAPNRAEKYNDYLNSTIQSLTAKTSNIPDSKKPKVLHVESITPLEVDGGNTIIDQWINVAGGINAASSVKGNMQTVSMEQIIAWDPDVIILGSNGVNGKTATILDITSNSHWANIAAVKNGKVFQNPTGCYLWDRYSPEEVLQLQWAAKTLHPDLFKDLDLTQITKDYYQDYLNYSLTDDDVERILASEPPKE